MNMRTDLIKFAVCNIDQEKIAKYADKTGRKVVSFNIDELDDDGKPIIEVVISNRDKVGEIRKEDFEIFRKTIPVAKDALIRIIEDTDVEVEDPGEGEPAVLDKVYYANVLLAVPANLSTNRSKQSIIAQKIGFSVLTVAILISCIKTALTVYPMAIFPGLALAALLIYVAFGNDLRNAKTGHSYLLTGRYKNDF
ncbi:MAG: hypothetical protein IKF70_03120 [Firmicutes bacterium]|nr:hypothetical protein [Bacillota bacterium]